MHLNKYFYSWIFQNSNLQVDSVIISANKMHNNGKLGSYKIRERTKVSRVDLFFVNKTKKNLLISYQSK